MIDVGQVYKWWDVFKDGHELTEVRILADNKTFSGYFSEIESLLSGIKQYDDYPGSQIYFTLNRINDACKGRAQSDKIIQIRREPTTGDSDIERRTHVLIDLDPKRPSGISSSNEELNFAYLKAVDCFNFLKEQGFYEPIVCCSGNGYHVILPCDIPVNDETTATIKKFLQVLSILFTDEHVEIDEKVFNPARICKLYGVTSRKGKSTKDRPWRQSCIVNVPEVIKQTDYAYFKKVADMAPEEEARPSKSNGYSSERFDLVDFLNKHGIGYKTERVAGGTKYILEHCPFNDQHKHKDAVIFQRDNGAIGFICMHNSCSDKTWRDVRLLFEPDAYDRHYEPTLSQNRNKQHYQKEDPKIFQPISATDSQGPIWLKFSDVKRPRIDLADYIPSGIPQIDRLTLGFRRKKVSVWSGIKGAGKSSLLNCLILNAAQKGYRSAIWTGELEDSEIKEWLYLQAAGKQHTKHKYGTDFYEVPDYIQDKIDVWIDKYVWLFNNRYESDYEQIEYQIRTLKEQVDIDVIILDNLMTMRLTSLAEDKYERQSILLDRLKRLSAELNIHIHLVAHPNKSRGFLRSDFISGTGDIGNKADYIFLLHRIGFDFENNAKAFLPQKVLHDILDSQCTNCIEIDKCRDKGTAVGKFVKLYYERESSRLKNDISENIIYNWDEGKNAMQSNIEFEEQMPWPTEEKSDLPF